MLDEALDVLVGLWSGEPFSYDGRYYHVAKAHFLPKPLQQPRIPIWVGGFWPNKAPFRRAAKWDGMFPLFDVWEEAEQLAQLEAVIAYVKERRQQEHPLDIVCMGMTPGAEPAQAAATVARRAQRGATWWLELIGPYILGKDLEDEWPLDAMRERVLQGPPIHRIENR